jgi:adenylate cyclase
MDMEIERKFLVLDDSWKSKATGSYQIEQGYVSKDETTSTRFRKITYKSGLTFHICTIKTSVPNSVLSRNEIEFEISKSVYEQMKTVHKGTLIIKERFQVPYMKQYFEVDVFESGLVLAELELKTEDQVITKPQWLGEDVTSNHSYKNTSMAGLQ